MPVCLVWRQRVSEDEVMCEECSRDVFDIGWEGEKEDVYANFELWLQISNDIQGAKTRPWLTASGCRR
jgi:hypothetical protein